MPSETIAALLVLSQILGGLSSFVAVVFALVAIPRALWQSAESRRSQAANQFYDAQRVTCASCEMLMREIEAYRGKVIGTDAAGRADMQVLDYISVQMRADQFRSDVTQTLAIFERAGSHVVVSDLLGLYRLVMNLSVLCESHAQSDIDEVASNTNHKIYKGALQQLVEQCSELSHWVDTDFRRLPTIATLIKKHPDALYDLTLSYNQSSTPR